MYIINWPFVLHVTANNYIVQQGTLKSFGIKNHETSFVDSKNLSKNMRTTAHLETSLEDCRTQER